MISGGSEHGVQFGREFFVHRVSSGPLVLRLILETVGLTRATAVDRAALIARVVEACDGIRRRDFLQPATWPDLPRVAAAGKPAYAAYGTILYALIHAPPSRLASTPSSTPMQRRTVFCAALGELGPVPEIAQALAALGEDDHATIRVTSARDAVQLWDRIAPHR